jgi:general secretion pathway protein N
MHSKRGLILAGLLTLLVGLLVMLPARVVYHFAAPPGVAVAGIQGSAWQGAAREASVGDLYLHDLRWQLQPLAILTGKLVYTVSAKPISGFVDAKVSIGLSGAATLTDLSASLPLSLFAGALGVRGLSGSASLDFERVEITGGIASAADGVIQVANLVVPIVDRNSLGGYKAEFFTQNNGITASVEDTDGVVDLAGSLQLRPDRSYQLVAQVVVTPQTPPSVQQQLKFLPPPNERGQQELRLEGVL